MNNRIRRSIVYLRLFRPFFHLLIIVISFYIIYNLRLYTDLIPFIQLRIPQINFAETMTFAVFAGFVFVFSGFLYGIYELFKPIHGYYRKFLKAWVFTVIVISFIAYFGHSFIFESGISRFILIVSSFLFWFLITLFDGFFNLFNSYLEKKVPYKILFIYTNKSFYDKIYKNFSFYKIYEVYGENISSIKENFEDNLNGFDIVVTLGSIKNNFLQNIVDFTRLNDIRYYHISSNYFLDDLIYIPERLGPLMVFHYKPSPLDGWYRVLKRLFDVLISAFVLILSSPLFGLIAILIKFDSKGPIFYKQKRVGKNGELFDFIKFRSMYIEMCVGDQYGGKDARAMYERLKKSKANTRKGSPLAKIKDDPRVTKVGRILRKSSLDELPQLYLIFKGHMSIVGPRPHLPEEVKNYEGWQKRLLSLKPGITGYSQIFGRDQLDFGEEAKLDLYYIQNWSLFIDIYVIITTIKVIFGGR